MGTVHILNGQVSQRVDGEGIGVLQVLMNGNTRREVHAEKNGFHFISIVLINAQTHRNLPTHHFNHLKPPGPRGNRKIQLVQLRYTIR